MTPRPSPTRTLLRAACLLGAVLAACTGSEPSPEPTTVSVSPGDAAFDAVGATRVFTASVLDQNGDPLPGTPVAWSSSASAVARVDAAGVVTAVSNGSATIRATAGSASGSATVVVAQRAASFEALAGNGQTGVAGQPLDDPLRVRVLDARGNPAGGVAVDFDVSAGDGAVAPGSVTSGPGGLAETFWTLGPAAGGDHAVDAAVPGSGLGSVSFRANAVAGPPATIDVLAGADQSGPRGRPLPAAVRVRVSDAFGNPVAATPVTFVVTGGGGSTAPAALQTDGQGVAATIWTLGNALGAQTLRVDAGAASTTVDATATVVPAQVIIEAGDDQRAPVDEPVPIPPAVRVVDAQANPAPGVPVTFTVLSGDGAIDVAAAAAAPPAAAGVPARADGDARTVVTGEDGVAALAAWTLGRSAGQNAVEARVSGVPPVVLTATAEPGTPAEVSVVDGDAQTGPVGVALPDPLVVEVRDRFGNPVPGATVSFAVTGGGGSLAATSVVTDGDGRGRVTWTLGSAEGQQTATAAVAGSQVTFTATATAAPGTMTAQAGLGQSATVAQQVATPPAVRVTSAEAVPLAGVAVTFTVTAGGGTIQGGGAAQGQVVVATDDAGIAALGAWTLGTRSGVANQQVTASAGGVADVTFTATATPDVPATFAKVFGDGQTGAPGDQLGSPVVVEVTDRFANPVSGVTVTFSVGEGGVTPTTADTEVSGRASALWTLGATEGAQQLTASVGGGFPDVTFFANAIPGGGEPPECVLAPRQAGFDIQLCYLSLVTPSVESAFNAAAARWGQLIAGDVPDIERTLPVDECFGNSPALDGTFDDLVIFVSVEEIDGAFGVLGSAGPCGLRFDEPATRLPYLGLMRFDESDLARLELEGDLEAVILHEMGHVLGFGTLWNFGPYDLLENPVNGVIDPDADTHFTGAAAVAAFNAAGGDVRTVDSPVPVENAQGGSGTLDGHWRESTMDEELMTGFLDGGVTNPLSAITVASLQDMGYTVDLGAADPYTVTNPNGAPPPGRDHRHIELVGDILRLPIHLVDAQGNVVGVIRR